MAVEEHAPFRRVAAAFGSQWAEESVVPTAEIREADPRGAGGRQEARAWGRTSVMASTRCL